MHHYSLINLFTQNENKVGVLANQYISDSQPNNDHQPETATEENNLDDNNTEFNNHNNSLDEGLKEKRRQNNNNNYRTFDVRKIKSSIWEALESSKVITLLKTVNYVKKRFHFI